MHPVRVRNTVIGEGMPKICVPIVGVTKEEIEAEAKAILQNSSVDIVEWRADWYVDVLDAMKVEDLLNLLREVLGNIPLLFTFRTLEEGGKKAIAVEDYVSLNRRIVQTGNADLIDVELFMGDEAVKAILKEVHAMGKQVIASNHDFHATPEKEEMLARLCRMQELGADILKLAVMPQSRRDVLRLLDVTEDMTTNYANCPVVTMAMGRLGLISRISGEAFGSALTFGALEKASAPGQMKVEDLETVLGLLHKNM
ncbi:MAG: type I 3-dehydroquinate dehydratase [Hespellia sp.]|nr:type I 3-dehydroquinate dehydratase [Hespellia sp.]